MVVWSAYSSSSFQTKLSGPSAIRSPNKYYIFRNSESRQPSCRRFSCHAERSPNSGTSIYFVTCLNSAELAAFRIRRLSHRPLKSDTVQLFYASDFAVAIYPPDSTGNSWQRPGVSAESQQFSAPNYQIIRQLG